MKMKIRTQLSEKNITLISLKPILNRSVTLNGLNIWQLNLFNAPLRKSEEFLFFKRDLKIYNLFWI